ncbi:DUF1702 family protein [Myxococcaceae bacterium JPH2]|nr:DUF1702 family protein [Myxococcaceae bacterium JPH2]
MPATPLRDDVKESPPGSAPPEPLGDTRTSWLPRLAAVARRGVFGLADSEASFARRGFRGAGGSTQAHLEHIGRTFILGYNTALETPRADGLVPRLQHVDVSMRGFAFEGAAMALALLDTLTPWGPSRVNAFLEGGAQSHVYMVHVGAGWAWARLHRDARRARAAMDPLLGWLGVDGYGFHQGYFHPQQFIERRARPGLGGYADRAFDQGLGRSLWFVEGAHVERVVSRIWSFPTSRRADLWAGVGLACTYAGGVEREALGVLRDAADDHLPALRQGVVFAARARERAGNPVPHVTWACEVLCGRGFSETAALAESALEACGPEDSEDAPRFERWRQNIQRAVAPPARSS